MWNLKLNSKKKYITQFTQYQPVSVFGLPSYYGWYGKNRYNNLKIRVITI